MYGLALVEMAQVAEQEHMREAVMARARAQARRERRRLRGPGRAARAWSAFWAPRNSVLDFRPCGPDSLTTDLPATADC